MGRVGGGGGGVGYHAIPQSFLFKFIILPVCSTEAVSLKDYMQSLGSLQFESRGKNNRNHKKS
eukprot:3947123-Karenia_brevis.AAC.1